MPTLIQSLRVFLVAALACAAATALAQDPPAADPLASDLEEEVAVRLVLVDALVVDGQGRTVPDLRLEDFEVRVDGQIRPIDTLDVGCSEGATEDVQAVGQPGRRAAPASSDEPRQIVLALDYLHLSQMERVDVLEQARAMVAGGAADDDRIMVVALNGGLRIEQPFTTDRAVLAKTLKRMEYDITLWKPAFEHLTERGFFAGMQALMALLDQVSGSKAVVLYSNSPAPGNENDPDFRALASLASNTRCSIYPVHAAGLTTPRPG